MHDVIYKWPNCFFSYNTKHLEILFLGLVMLKNCFRLKLTECMLVTSNLSKYQRFLGLVDLQMGSEYWTSSVCQWSDLLILSEFKTKNVHTGVQNVWQLVWGQFHKRFCALTPNFCTLRPIFEKLFTRKKVGPTMWKFGVGRKKVYEIDPWCIPHS